MKLTKANSPIKVKTGEDFKVYKCLIEGLSVNGVSVLHAGTMDMDGDETFEFMTNYFKSNKDWRSNAALCTTTVDGKEISYVQIGDDLEDTDF